MLGKAWRCVARRVTFRPCDTSFKQDVKDHLLAPLALRSPRLVKPASVALEVVAVLIVVTTVASLYIVARSGLNLWVYGTCDKQNAQSCSLGAESCSIESATPTFWQSLTSGDVVGALVNEGTSLGETFADIPNRLKSWDATAYLPEDASYLEPYDASKPTAVEILDPGCVVCGELFHNIESSGFADRYNVAYIAFPIPDGDSGYKFANSLLTAQYLEALRLHPLTGADTPADWQLLETIYTGENAVGVSNQAVLNAVSADDAVSMIQEWLAGFGYTQEQISQIAEEAAGATVAARISAEHDMVVDDIRTLKIPSIIYDGRLHGGLVSSDALAKARG